MARRLRIQFEGAMYHVINRGNYRRDVFETAGAAKAFEATLGETCGRFRWRMHAHVVMRNHYHLAVTTTEPNLADGMHWLQSTFATRFNRLRDERGHLFQGRYHALLIENAAALGRVASYIHLNPVRAKILPPDQVGQFRWSSLRRVLAGSSDEFVSAAEWLGALGFDDNRDGRTRYLKHLIALSTDELAQERMEFGQMERGWAIGTSGWRKTIAKEYSHLAVSAGVPHDELTELKRSRWEELLRIALEKAGKAATDIATDRKGARWKVALAAELKNKAGAPAHWIAQNLNMGAASTVRVYIRRSNEITA